MITRETKSKISGFSPVHSYRVAKMHTAINKAFQNQVCRTSTSTPSPCKQMQTEIEDGSITDKKERE